MKTDSEKLREHATWVEVQAIGGIHEVKEYCKSTATDLRRIADEMDAVQPLTGDQEKAFEAFIEVCDASMPTDQFEYGMIKMKAFLAGRAFECWKPPTVGDEEIEALEMIKKVCHDPIRLTRNYRREELGKRYPETAYDRMLESAWKWLNKK